MEVDGRFCLQMNIESIIYFNCVERYEDSRSPKKNGSWQSAAPVSQFFSGIDFTAA